MPRYANPYPNGPYPTDATFGIAAESIARALFGDPQARAEQEQQQAQMDRIKAATGYDLSRTEGVDIQNRASRGLPGIFAQILAPQQQPQIQAPPVTDMASLAEMATGAAPMPAVPVVAAPTAAEPFDGINVVGAKPINFDDALRNMTPELLATLAQAQGDKVDPNALLGGLAAIFGSDEMARRGMVGQGKTPDKDFALTMERADDIAAQGYDADYKSKTGVATINNRDNIPVANIRAGATVDAARIAGDSRVEVAGVQNVGKTDVALIKEGGAPVADGRATALSVYPGLKITQNARDPNSALGRANPESFHNSTKAAVDSKALPGMTFEQYVQGYRDAGYTILEAKDEYKNPSKHATGPHWHVVLGQKSGKGGKASGKAAEPVKVTGPDQKSLQEGITAIFKRVGISKASPKNKNRALARLTRFYQETGNMAEAMLRSETELAASLKRVNERQNGGGWGPIQVVK